MKKFLGRMKQEADDQIWKIYSVDRMLHFYKNIYSILSNDFLTSVC